MKKKCWSKMRWGGLLLLGIYLACLSYFLFFSESYGRFGHGNYRYNLIPFREIRRFLVYRDALGTAAVMVNLVGNVAVFIPFGAAVPALFPKTQNFLRVMILSFSASLLAETTQLLLKVGCFDVDDLLLNTIGGCLGYLLFAGCRYLWRGNGKKDL